MVQFLIEQGADVNELSGKGQTLVLQDLRLRKTLDILDILDILANYISQ